MEKQFDVDVLDTVVLMAANEESASAPALLAATPKSDAIEVRGCSAYEIWHSRIRLLRGVTGLYLLQA
jgi:hypothetical protein